MALGAVGLALAAWGPVKALVAGFPTEEGFDLASFAGWMVPFILGVALAALLVVIKRLGWHLVFSRSVYGRHSERILLERNALTDSYSVRSALGMPFVQVSVPYSAVTGLTLSQGDQVLIVRGRITRTRMIRGEFGLVPARAHAPVVEDGQHVVPLCIKDAQAFLDELSRRTGATIEKVDHVADKMLEERS